MCCFLPELRVYPQELRLSRPSGPRQGLTRERSTFRAAARFTSDDACRRAVAVVVVDRRLFAAPMLDNMPGM